MKAYVVNLEHESARRESILKSLRSLGIEPIVINAVYGKMIPKSRLTEFYDDVTAKRMAKRSLYPGEIGCALSHLKVYERIVSDGDDVALVMEDDAVVDEALLDVIGLLSQVTVDADVLLLGHHPPYSYEAITRTSMWNRQSLPNRRHLGFPVEPAYGTYCYTITAEAAKVILKLNQPVWNSSDYFTAGAEGAIRTKVLVPPVAHVNFSLGSSIEEDRIRPVAAPRRGFLYRLARAIKPLRDIRRAFVRVVRECSRAALMFTLGSRPPASAPMAIKPVASPKNRLP